MLKICFDYGHGGWDPGALYGDRREKDDVLDLGRRVAAEVRRHGPIVDETRSSDRSISLAERVAFERENTYDYFISFHRNAFRPEEARGVEVFVYRKATRRARELAGKIQSSLVGLGFVDRGVKRAGFYVLRNTRAPALLLEIGFLDNSLDNKLFDEKREKIAEEISKAILSHLSIAYIKK